MRLAYLATRFPLISETFILNEMLALTRLGHEVFIFALRHARPHRRHPGAVEFEDSACFGDRPASLILAQLYWLWRRPRVLGQLWQRLLVNFGRRPELLWRNAIALLAGAYFAQRLAPGRFDHIHAHWAHHTTFAALCASRLCGLPYSFTAHANDIFVDQTMLAEKASLATQVVTISEYNRGWLEKHLQPRDRDKIRVIRCGIDLSLYQAPARQRRRSHAPVFICLARLHEKKGHRYLLEACALLQAEGREFRCWLIGEGPLESSIRRQIGEAVLQERVDLLGPLAQPDVVRRLARADYMVLPSVTTATGRREGIPVSLMEGLAMGLPVIATRLSGTPELIRDRETGLLVPEKDSASLATAMAFLLDHPEQAAALAQAGRALVAHQHDLDRNCRELSALFKAPRELSDQGGRPLLYAGEGG